MSDWATGLPLSVIGGHIPSHLLNVMCTDFAISETNYGGCCDCFVFLKEFQTMTF